MRPAFLCLAILTACSATLSAQVIYQTGFESPPFSDGNLLAQDGWQSTDDPATPGRAVIQSTFANSGLRAVRIDASVTSFTDWFWKDLSFPVPLATNPVVQIRWNMYLDGTGSAKSLGWGIDVYDNSSPTSRRVMAVIVDAVGSIKIWNGNTFFDTTVQVARDEWHSFTLNMNYAAASRKASLYFNGVRIAEDRLFSPSTTNTLADVDLYNIDGGANDAAFFDNFSVSALPDGDGDGLSTAEDACPNTPAGDPIDPTGCSTIDSDGDGILNDFDACPNTPTCAQIDGSGCPFDPDGDSILTGCDNCPSVNNPFQQDADGDGMGDACDACLNRRPGDVNGDGQTDGRDIIRFKNIIFGASASFDDVCAGDFDGNQAMTSADVPGFVNALVGI